ncbi:hypothetical protein GGI21_002709, partial [Coemansia aciculifera]
TAAAHDSAADDNSETGAAPGEASWHDDKVDRALIRAHDYEMVAAIIKAQRRVIPCWEFDLALAPIKKAAAAFCLSAVAHSTAVFDRHTLTLAVTANMPVHHIADLERIAAASSSEAIAKHEDLLEMVIWADYFIMNIEEMIAAMDSVDSEELVVAAESVIAMEPVSAAKLLDAKELVVTREKCAAMRSATAMELLAAEEQYVVGKPVISSKCIVTSKSVIVDHSGVNTHATSSPKAATSPSTATRAATALRTCWPKSASAAAAASKRNSNLGVNTRATSSSKAATSFSAATRAATTIHTCSPKSTSAAAAAAGKHINNLGVSTCARFSPKSVRHFSDATRSATDEFADASTNTSTVSVAFAVDDKRSNNLGTRTCARFSPKSPRRSSDATRFATDESEDESKSDPVVSSADCAASAEYTEDNNEAAEQSVVNAVLSAQYAELSICDIGGKSVAATVPVSSDQPSAADKQDKSSKQQVSKEHKQQRRRDRSLGKLSQLRRREMGHNTNIQALMADAGGNAAIGIIRSHDAACEHNNEHLVGSKRLYPGPPVNMRALDRRERQHVQRIMMWLNWPRAATSTAYAAMLLAAFTPTANFAPVSVDMEIDTDDNMDVDTLSALPDQGVSQNNYNSDMTVDPVNEQNPQRQPPLGYAQGNGHRRPPLGYAQGNNHNQPPLGHAQENGHRQPPLGYAQENGHRQPPLGYAQENGHRQPPLGYVQENGHRQPPLGYVQGNGHNHPPLGHVHENGHRQPTPDYSQPQARQPPPGHAHEYGLLQPPLDYAHENGHRQPTLHHAHALHEQQSEEERTRAHTPLNRPQTPGPAAGAANNADDDWETATEDTVPDDNPSTSEVEV